jgi:hypothetical protein
MTAEMRGTTGDEAQARMTRDLAAGRPIVVHVIVALCDNVHQGIVPVPKHLGNGQDPGSNLYWGAAFGVQSYLSRQAVWTRVPVAIPGYGSVLDRAIFFGQIQRHGKPAPVYIVADAWDGATIRSAIERFLKMAGGGSSEEVTIRQGTDSVTLAAGGSAHLVAFVGHDGLMDFSLPRPVPAAAGRAAGSSIVLACASKPYFLERLRAVGSHPLLLTTGLMAPEAYTLDAAIRSWAGRGSVAAVREAAALAYQKYQKSGIGGARKLFWGE